MNDFFIFVILVAIFIALFNILQEIKQWRKQATQDFNLLATMIGEHLSIEEKEQN